MAAARKHKDESAFVALLKKRDKSAFADLYDNYSAALLGVLSRILENEELAEDILQEVFATFYMKIESYDSKKGRLFTWMLNISRNRAIDVRRSKAFRTKSVIQPIEKAVHIEDDVPYERESDAIGLKGFVAKLPETHRIIIDLLYFGGYTQSEAAKELDIPLGTVKSRARSAIQELRKMMQA